MSRTAICFGLLALLSWPAAAAHAEEADQQLRQRWLDYYQQEASAYEITCRGEADERLEFQPKILFQYTNPVREYGQHGAFFVWTLDGRPEAAGTIWSTINQRDKTKRFVAHELHSLSLAPLESQRPDAVDVQGRPVPQWKPTEPGIELVTLRSAPPAKNAAGRLIQMRQLARKFSAISKHPKEDSPRKLRLMPQPLYRYSSPRAEVIDGAIFAFVMGTDPELLLQLEARPTQTGSNWQFAAARFTHIDTELRYDGQLVWQCGEARMLVGDQPFFLYLRMRELDAELGKEGE